MGILLRFQLSGDLVERFPYFIETGVGAGVSLRYAADCSFTRLASIEYDKRLVKSARRQFADNHRVQIIHGNSADRLGSCIKTFPPGSGFVFWLDAHWPGSDYFGEPYIVGDPRISLPLKWELQAISDNWHVHRGEFVAVVDDVASMMMLDRGARYLFDLFDSTHTTTIHRKDDGYAVIAPRGLECGPELIEQYDIRQLVSACRRHLECGHWPGARGFAAAIVAMTDGGIDPPDVSAKMIGRGEACRFFAAEAVSNGNPGIASHHFIHAMDADPLCIDYRMDYIYQVLLPVNWTAVAFNEAKAATKIWPENARAWCALTEVHRRMGNKEAAVTAMAEAQKLPRIGMTDLLGAQLAGDVGEFSQSARLYRKVIDEHPERLGECLVGQGVVAARDGRFEEAISFFDEALENNPPDPALCRWNRAETLLTLGRYAEGWPDHGRRFELELKLPGVGSANTRFRRPRWEPDMDPCRILVQGEQGFGDVICMARYVPMLRDMGNHVQFEVDPKLVDLFRQSPAFAGIKIIPRAPNYPGWLGIEDFDANMPAMCFPAAFATGIDTVPWTGPYLYAIPTSPRPKRRPLIGLCWSSGRREGLWEDEYCNRKSVPWTSAGKLVDIISNRVDWHLFEFPTERMVADLPGPSFADTAAVLAQCDLLITVDTGIAHLAGAMGMPTWIMMHGPAGSWHWMCDKADGGKWAERSPWYPSVRLFRQKQPHEWLEVIDNISAALELWLLRS